MSMDSRSFGLLALVAVVSLATFPLWGPPASTSRKLDDRIEQLEREQRRIATELRDHDARVIHLELLKAEVDEALGRVLPQEARWLALAAGQGERWDFPIGGRAQVKYLHLDDEGAPVFHVENRAVTAQLALPAGTAMRAVDDLGQQLRVYTTAVHQIRTDRSGRPDAALVSVVVSFESPAQAP